MRQFGRLLSPALTDVRASWGGLDATQSPTTIPPVFAGGRLLLYAFVKEVTTGGTPATVRLAATSPSGPVTFDVEFDASRVVDGRTVATLAARARIRELEEGPEWTSARGSQQRERKAGGTSSEIIELSIRYGLMSRETSFVAVERRETPVLGDMQLRRIPIALTAGWGGLERMRGRTYGAVMPRAAAMTLGAPGARRRDDDTQEMLSIARSAFRPVPPTVRLDAPDGAATGSIRRGLDRLRRWGRGTTPSDQDPDLTPSALTSGMLAVAALQRADGSWELTEALARAIGHDLGELEALLAGATGKKDEARKAWATALALAWLEEHARDQEDEWRLLAVKARTWLGHVSARPPAGGSWLDAGARLLTAKSG